MEELLTVADEDEAAAAAEAIAALMDELRELRVIATVRSDFLGRLSALDRLGDRVTRSLYLLQPLTPQRARDAIVGPAMTTGVRFESRALVDELAAACGAGAGGLPLLQFALSTLWEARDLARGMICEATLASIGGVSGALARHADGVLASLRPEHRPLARRLVLMMVTPEGTRAHAGAEELLGADDDPAAVRAVLETLVRGRLVTVADGGGAPAPVYRIAHDVLLDGWDTLRGWRAQELERGAVRGRLRRAAAEWDRHGRSAEMLWSRRQLDETTGLDEVGLAAIDRAFLGASRCPAPAPGGARPGAGRAAARRGRLGRGDASGAAPRRARHRRPSRRCGGRREPGASRRRRGRSVSSPGVRGVRHRPHR
jgi:hypothetical protein